MIHFPATLHHNSVKNNIYVQACLKDGMQNLVFLSLARWCCIKLTVEPDDLDHVLLPALLDLAAAAAKVGQLVQVLLLLSHVPVQALGQGVEPIADLILYTQGVQKT